MTGGNGPRLRRNVESGILVVLALLNAALVCGNCACGILSLLVLTAYATISRPLNPCVATCARSGAGPGILYAIVPPALVLSGTLLRAPSSPYLSALWWAGWACSLGAVQTLRLRHAWPRTRFGVPVRNAQPAEFNFAATGLRRAAKVALLSLLAAAGAVAAPSALRARGGACGALRVWATVALVLACFEAILPRVMQGLRRSFTYGTSERNH